MLTLCPEQPALQCLENLLGLFRNLLLADELPYTTNLVTGGPEYEGVLFTHLLMYFDVGPIHGPNNYPPIHHELHVGGAASLHTRRGYMLADIRGGYKYLSHGYVVVGDIYHLQQPVDAQVIVDGVADTGQQLYNPLGRYIAWGSLTSKDDCPPHLLPPLLLSHTLKLKVPVHHLQGIHQLSLVLVDTLHLDIEQGERVHLNPHFL